MYDYPPAHSGEAHLLPDFRWEMRQGASDSLRPAALRKFCRIFYREAQATRSYDKNRTRLKTSSVLSGGLLSFCSHFV